MWLWAALGYLVGRAGSNAALPEQVKRDRYGARQARKAQKRAAHARTARLQAWLFVIVGVLAVIVVIANLVNGK